MEISNELRRLVDPNGKCCCEYCLIFKCKEWAIDKYDIAIPSALYKNYAKSWNLDKDKSYTAKTEVEVIIEACSGILEELNEKI